MDDANMSDSNMSNSITSNPKEHVFYFVFRLRPGIEECTPIMLLSCLKCLRAHEDVKVLTSTEEWDRHGEDARDGEVALEVVTEHGDIEGASALAELHIEGLLRDWPDADDPRAAGFYMAVYSRERVSDAESNVEEHVDQVDADLEACTQSLRLAEIGSFGEDLDTAVAALDDWHMCEK